MREKGLKTSIRFEAATCSSVDKKQLHVNCAHDITKIFNLKLLVRAD